MCKVRAFCFAAASVVGCWGIAAAQSPPGGADSHDAPPHGQDAQIAPDPTTAAAGESAPGAASPGGSLVLIQDSVEPVKARFNRNADKFRIMGMFSPTCLNCQNAVRAARDAVLTGYPDMDLDVTIVWVDIFRSDSADAAREAAKIITDPRGQNYYDPNRHVAEMFAPLINMPTLARVLEGMGDSAPSMRTVYKPALIEDEPAVYDTFFFYWPGATWDDRPPVPNDWLTQIDGTRYPGVDVNHYEARFAKGLRRVVDRYRMERLLKQADEKRSAPNTSPGSNTRR